MATENRPKGGVSPGALRAIKVSVILMGLLIVGGMAVIVVTLISRASNLGGSGDGESGDGRSDGGGPVAPAEASLALGAGDRIESAVLDGDRALLIVARADGTQDVLVVDLRSGDTVLTLDGAPDSVNLGTE